MLKTNALLLSTDTLPNYGLDLIFSITKEAGFDGIDLAMWKGFDAWDEEYVQKLAFEYDLPVYAIQTSAKLNQKEMDKALDLCAATGADTICINAPKITEFKVYDFIADNLAEYQKNNPDLNFAIINPINSKLFALPIPEFRFSNIVDIVKKYSAYVGLDISNLDTDSFEEDFSRTLEDYAPYISVLYLSDKDRKGKSHLVPGEGSLDLVGFLKKLKKS
jgi:sugar phosphate isomerase/epimerase